MRKKVFGVPALMALMLLSSMLASSYVFQLAGSESDLVGYWKFDEGEGDTASDSSGNGNDGTLVNGPTWVNGRYGLALSFDGVDDYVEVPDTEFWNFGDTNFSIGMWVKFNSVTGFQDIIGQSDGAGAQNKWMIGYNFPLTNKISFHMHGDTVKDLTADLIASTGLWYHIFFTRESNVWKFYVNGVNISSETFTGAVPDSTSTLKIGVDGELWKYFNGIIDEVKIYDSALSAEEIKAQFQGLVGYWKFDEGSGTIAYDSSGNGKDITLYGNPTWVSGYSGYALEFDGVDDWGTFSALYASSPSSLKIQALIYPHELMYTLAWDGHGEIIYTGDNGEFAATVHGGNAAFAVKLTTGGWHEIIATTTINAWHNLTGVWTKGGYMWLYLDGVLVVAKNVQDYGLNTPGITPSIGASPGGSRSFFDGVVDEVKVYTNVSPPPPPPSNYCTLMTSTSTGQGEYGASTNPRPGVPSMYRPGTVVNVTALQDTGGQYQFDHWELNGTNVGPQNPYPLTMDTSYALHAVFVATPYDVTIDAYCYPEATAVSVSLTMDGSPTGYNTPHTFTGLTGTHTFTVPSTDANGHLFKQWNTSETSTTITVNSGGTFTTYYESVHDVAVFSVTASATSVTQGETVTITVVVKNEGTFSESFSVTAYYDNTAIDSQTVTNLSPGASQTLYFYWDTGGVALGTYTIKAVASTVPEETDTTDNTKIDGTITVTAAVGGGLGSRKFPLFEDV